MRKRPYLYTLTLVFITFFTWSKINAQGYIQFSTYNGGSKNDGYAGATSDSPSFLPIMVVENGETYIAGYTKSTDFPVTNSSAFMGGDYDYDIVVTKFDTAGSVVFSTYLGSAGQDQLIEMKVLNGEVYLVANAYETGFPVTNGSSVHLDSNGYVTRDVVITKIGRTGNIILCTYLGGSGDDYAVAGMQILNNGNTILVGGYTYSLNFPADPGESFHGSTERSDVFITTLNATDGSIIHSKFIGGNSYDMVSNILYENNYVYVVGYTQSTDLPITTGPTPVFTTEDNNIFISKYNIADLSNSYCCYLGGSHSDYSSRVQVKNGVLYIIGYTYSTDFPVTDGSAVTPPTNYWTYYGFYTKININGNIDFSTYLSPNSTSPGLLEITGANVYITTGTEVLKFANNGSRVWSKTLNGVLATAIKEINGALYIAGRAADPADDGFLYSYNSVVLNKLDSLGNIIQSTVQPAGFFAVTKFYDDKIYFLTKASRAFYKVTDGSTLQGDVDNMLVILNLDGSLFYSGYTGGKSREYPCNLEIDNSGVYMSGITLSNDYPVTNTVLYKGDYDQFITKLGFCPSSYLTGRDTLFPRSQTTCKNGMANTVTGIRIISDTNSTPAIFRNGILLPRPYIEAIYQWQKAPSPAGPWVDIPNATLKDYVPFVGEADQYYRRQSFRMPQCGGGIVQTSDTVVILVNNLQAPVLDGGINRVTCPGSAITIGGAPTATGGNPPYHYNWDRVAGDNSNPVVAPLANTIYTLTVTDSLGCKQVAQSVVYTYSADAGADQFNCAGNAARIGGFPPTGVPGIVYTWSPATGITNPAAAQPYASPAAETNYTLTLTVPKTGGGTCYTTDTVKVTPVTGPVTADFAGPDRVICKGDTAYIGTDPEPGFSYYWAPSFYLTSNTESKTKYFGGNLVTPSPNPALINVTAQKNGCAFSDIVEVATIESNAGKNKCGPGNIGEADKTPGINESYSWSLISGPGNFTGPVNEAIVPISASIGGNSVYGLTVSYKGHSCYSEVTIYEACDTPRCRGIAVNAKYRCPNYGINGGDVTLTVLHSIPGDVIYSWLPQAGLSAYNTQTVSLTDNVSRTYRVTVTSVADPSIVEYDTITVNNPAASVPVFITPDSFTVCNNTPTEIGMPPVAGNLYAWSGAGLSSNTVSNPVITTASQKNYLVRVYDNTGCEITDTVTVLVQNTRADAGQDWVICSNGIAKLGSPAQPGTTYSWEPQISPWQNGTNQNSAQPEVLVATNLSFSVAAVTTAGCISRDTVNVIINNNPTINNLFNATVCKGDSVMIGSTALPGVTYQWNPSTGLSDPGIAQPKASPENNTIYTVTATFTGNCATTAARSVQVTVRSIALSMPDIHYCPSNGALQLGNNAPSGNNYFYFWQPYNIVTTNFIRNPVTYDPPPNIPTTVSLFVSDANGCSAIDSFMIIPDITAPAAGTDKTVCYHTSTNIGSASNVTGPGITYSWSPSANLDNNTAINPIFTGNTPGIFQYVLSKTENGCTSKDTVTITVSDTLLTGLQSPVVCKNSCIQIGVSPLPATGYQWTPSTGLSNANIANPVACVGSDPVTYSVTATDNYGCTNTATITIGVSATPAPQLNVPNITACVGDTGVRFNPVIGSGPYAYQWSPNNGTINNIYSANPSIAVPGTGIFTYTLQVTDTITGCTNSDAGTIQANICNNSCRMGDYMWFDLNGDGKQDPDEPGVSGMNVKLFNSHDINIASTATNAEGLYSFSNISPGNGYYIVFSKPAGYQFTLQNIDGLNISNNSKADATGRSNSFNIVGGGATMNIDAGIKPSGTTPVILLSFTANQQADHSVLLNWQTTAEYNCAYFTIQRSVDGIHFVPIGKMDGHGTTSLPNSYSFTDKNPFPGTNYYRLQQVDKDGRFVYSNIAVIQNKTAASITAVYNTAANTIDIRFAEKQNNAMIRLLSYNGQVIKSLSAGNVRNYLLQLPAVANGIYVLQVMNDKINYAEKFFIRR